MLLSLLFLLLVAPRWSLGLPAPIQVTYLVAEEDRNTIIGHLLTDAGIVPNPDASVKLRILRGQHKELFTIQGDSPDELQASWPLDREALCPGDSLLQPCVLQMDVTVLVNLQLHWLLNVEITVMDINDNAPEFGAENYTIEVPKDAIIGSTFLLPTASDLDNGDNSVQGYIIPDHYGDYFSVHNYETENGVKYPKLVVNTDLKRVAMDTYGFELVAMDGGLPLKYGSASIIVKIIQSNDHSPKFIQDIFNISIPEDHKLGFLFNVTATDLDSGKNGDMIYCFNNDLLVSYDSVLAIDNSSGALTLLQPLDYEIQRSYNYIILATDRGNKPLTSSAEVHITVTDINDNTPMVTIETNTNSNHSTIPEDSPTGTFVAIVTTFDADSGTNGDVTCTLSSEIFELRYLFLNNHQISLVGELDFEIQENYTVEIKCSDNGAIPLVAFSTLDISIQDANDNSPVFERAFYNLSVLENSNAHVPLIKVVAHDIDSGANGQINYSIVEVPIRRWLSVDAQSGALSTLITFDYEFETQRQIEFTLAASDNGTPPRVSYAHAQITVIDRNDEAPEFTTKCFTFHVRENSRKGRFVGQISAVDKDSLPFNFIRYKIRNDTYDARAFDINATTGEIRTKLVLDREMRPVYYFQAFAIDGAGPSFHTSTTEITVHVSDENDNAPVITFPDKENNTVSIPFDADDSFLVTQIQAYDEDIDLNAKLIYTILNGNEKHCFYINQNDGTIYINGTNFKLSTQNRFIFNIIVEDSALPPKSAYTILYITIDKSVAMDNGNTMKGSKKQVFGSMHYQHKVTLVLVPITVLLLLALVLLLGCIKVRQRKQRHSNHKYGGHKAEMTHLRGGFDTSAPVHDFSPDIEYEIGNPAPENAKYDAVKPEQEPSQYGPQSHSHNSTQNNETEKSEVLFHTSEHDLLPSDGVLPEDEAIMRLHKAGLAPADKGTPADMQLYKLLRFLNEVERAQLVSSATESTCHDVTGISAADSGTGMSEDDAYAAEERGYYGNQVAFVSPYRENAAVGGRKEDNVLDNHHVHNNGNKNQLFNSGALEPDQFYEIRNGDSYASPKIVINTRKGARNPPSSFKLRSPRKTLAKFKLMQTFGKSASNSSTDGAICDVTHSRGENYAQSVIGVISVNQNQESAKPINTEDRVDNHKSIDSLESECTMSETESSCSMNSSQTYRNTRQQPMSFGTFKPHNIEKTGQHLAEAGSAINRLAATYNGIDTKANTTV